MQKILATLLVGLALIACSQQDGEPASAVAEPTPIDPAIYAAAVANPSRLEGDYARDAGRKPAEVMEFFGFAPGMTVLDMFSGGGYYAELLSHVVGPQGAIVAQSNLTYLDFVGDEFAARHADDRLPNVEVLMAENNELDLAANRFDMIMMALAYHDIYWVAPEQGWLEIDVPKLHAEFIQSLKPGGILAIVDHYAAPGSPRESGGTVHRIDPDIVIAELESAGFVMQDTSDILRNPEDDYSKGVFDPSVRGSTDRFVLLFRKPE